MWVMLTANYYQYAFIQADKKTISILYLGSQNNVVYMKFSDLLFVLICFMLINSCSNDKNVQEKTDAIQAENDQTSVPTEDLKKYYFPSDQFSDTIIYHYQSVDGAQQMYWVMNSFELNGILKFNTTIIAPDDKSGCRKIEFISEDILADGSHVNAYTEYKFDGSSRILEAIGTIQESMVFKWNQTTTERITWQTEQMIKENPAFLQKFSKTRSLIGTDSTFVFNEDTLECAVFKDDIHMEVINQMSGKTSVTDFYQYSYYATNTGLVKYVRTFQDNSSVAFYLTEIIDGSNWVDICPNIK